MPQWVANILLSSRTWLTASALSISAALVIGYHQDQMSAQQVLTQKVGKPEEVLIQDFSQDQHMNLINEVCILGEMVPGAHAIINVGTAESPSWVVVSPIFPVGTETRPFAEQYFAESNGASRRPMPREAAAGLAERRSAIANLSTSALAFSVRAIDSPEAVSTPMDLDAFQVLAEGETRKLVSVSGAVISGNGLRDKVAEVIADDGFTIDPSGLFIDPSRYQGSLAIVPDMIGGLRHWFVLAAVLFAVAALLLPHLGLRRPSRPSASVASARVRATSKLPAVDIFQPIATQDELAHIEEQAVAKRADRENVWINMARIATSLLQSATRIKSPR